MIRIEKKELKKVITALKLKKDYHYQQKVAFELLNIEKIRLTTTESNESETVVSHDLRAEAQKFESFLIGLKELENTFKDLKGIITIYVFDDSVEVFDERAQVVVYTKRIEDHQDYLDYPKIAQVDVNKDISCLLNFNKFMEGINKVAFSMSSEYDRYIYSGVYVRLLALERKIEFCATDGRRLTYTVMDNFRGNRENKAFHDKHLIISNNCVKALQKLHKLHEEENLSLFIAIKKIDNRGQSQIKNVKLKTKLFEINHKCLDGHFPDYKKVIPEKDNFNAVFKIDHEFVEACETIEKKKPIHRQVRFIISKDTVKMKASIDGRDGYEEFETNLKIKTGLKGENIIIGLEIRYLNEIFKNHKSDVEDLKIGLTNAGKIVRLMSKKDKALNYLVMPMRL